MGKFSRLMAAFSLMAFPGHAQEEFSFSCLPHRELQQDLHHKLCAEIDMSLKAKLASRGEKRTFSAPTLAVQLEVVEVSRISISGRLRWKRQELDGWTSGPIIETTISDANLNDRVVREFARGLVATSNIN